MKVLLTHEYRSLWKADCATAEPLDARRDLDSYILAVQKLVEERVEGAASSSSAPGR